MSGILSRVMHELSVLRTPLASCGRTIAMVHTDYIARTVAGEDITIILPAGAVTKSHSAQ
jgi:hypothetical protein